MALGWIKAALLASTLWQPPDYVALRFQEPGSLTVPVAFAGAVGPAMAAMAGSLFKPLGRALGAVGNVPSPWAAKSIFVRVYDTAGSGSFTVPAGCTSLDQIHVISGGGAGQPNAGRGGAGGGYAFYDNYGVTPGQVIPFQVGAGGVYSLTAPTDGGTSYFGAIITVTGGLSGANGGTGGVATGGKINRNGGRGGNSGGNPGGGGGAAGPDANGGAGVDGSGSTSGGASGAGGGFAPNLGTPGVGGAATGGDTAASGFGVGGLPGGLGGPGGKGGPNGTLGTSGSPPSANYASPLAFGAAAPTVNTNGGGGGGGGYGGGGGAGGAVGNGYGGSGAPGAVILVFSA